MFSEEQRKNICNNIKILMTFYKEKQRDLADILEVSEGSISGYIKGTTIPKREILSKIAKHYNITEFQLINDDYSYFEKINENDSYDFLIKGIKIYPKLFPIIEINNDEKDIYLKEAIKLNKIFWEKFEAKSDDLISEIMELYCKSYDETKNLDSYANLIQMFLIVKTGDDNISEYIDIYNSNPFNKDDLENIVKDCILKNFDDELEDNNDLNDKDLVWEFIDDVLSILSEDERYKDFAHYYIAIKYFLGNGIDNKPKELIRMIGLEMLANLCTLNNKYAVNVASNLLELMETSN